MNVVKCENGHFYDGEQYSLCPHCGARMSTGNAPAAQAAPAEKPKKSHLPLFGRKNKAEAAAPIQTPAATMGGYGNAYSYGSDGSEVTETLNQPAYQPVSQPSYQPVSQPAYQTASQPVSQPRPQTEKTLDFWQLNQQLEEPVQPQIQQNPAYAQPEPECAASNDYVQPEPEKPRQPEAGSLRDAIQRASAGGDGKTVGVFSTGKENPLSVASSAEDAPVDPVVGWLVCIKGKHFGESFHISAGKNSIGRSPENNIVLRKDNSVSRSKHALLVYEPKKRNFYLQPGDSSGLTYLNDEYITESKKMAPRDIIELGDSQFMFIPLCGESFTWEDYITKE